LQHILLRGALKRASKEVANGLAARAVEEVCVSPCVHIPQQTGKLAIGFFQQALKNLVEGFVRATSAKLPFWEMKRRLGLIHRGQHLRKII